MYPQPAYTAVAARQTLQRPTPAPAVEPPKAKKVSWSPGVRGYVQRAFDADNAMAGIETPEMQQRLKVVITQAAEAGQLETIDWTVYPLPQHLIQAERNAAALSSTHAAHIANLNNATSYLSNGAYSPDRNNKRKNGDLGATAAEESELTPPWKKNNTNKGSLEDRMTGKSKKQDKKQKKTDAFRANNLGTDAHVLEKRKQRFGYTSPEPSPYPSSRNDSPERTGPLVGTCQKIEKSYFRLTAPPAPDTVRPLPILEQALSHIRTKWKNEHNYNYACDQLKSLRQDLTVQHIQNELTAKVYECHARIALEMKDLGEYNQCQTQLRALYKSGVPGRSEEFTAYRILYTVYTCNRTDMNNLLADLTPADKQKSGVQHALQVRSALASGNYHKFFRLYRDAPFMGPYLLDMIIQRERIAAMAAICRAYKPDVSLSFIAQELAFFGDGDSPEPDASQQCIEFLCEHGGEPFIDRSVVDNVRFQTGKAIQAFQDQRAAAFRSVDIKGQI
ncbi:hypothetical protein LTR56_021025 [Elasticomyces elasticus]|nr:hypothetical protein LTR56_021025 [Elasticomyces elasticus]KAK3646941.1 hypothetical protein LTR22_014094 [Elasticomyces elasticus]KAK4909886.1 hypothetical protein LTR49_021371 [Elasticomyces elasticus]KAK5766533.1 hypothetical protein LTS12_003151 [Elasticomyces elasticus]